VTVGTHSLDSSSCSNSVPPRRIAAVLKVYSVSKVNPMARGRARDLRVLWALEEMKQALVTPARRSAHR